MTENIVVFCGVGLYLYFVCQRGTNPTKIPNETKKSSKLATILIVYKKA
jgi:hypothetical protein